MRPPASTLSVRIILCSLAALATAGSPHLVGRPVSTDNGNTPNVAETVAGLLPHDVRVHVSAAGTSSLTCTNLGGSEPAGQNRDGQTLRVKVKGERTVLASELENGVAAFSFAAMAPTWSSGMEAACPSVHWTAETHDITFRNATLRVSRSGQTQIMRSFRL